MKAGAQNPVQVSHMDGQDRGLETSLLPTRVRVSRAGVQTQMLGASILLPQ